MMPPALGRFSTMTVWPSGLAMAFATTRATVSVGAPAAEGTSMLMLWVGYCCPAALVDNAVAAAKEHRRERVFILNSGDREDSGAPGGIRTHDPWLRRPIL